MPTTFDDPIVRRRGETQKSLFEKAGGDFKKYNGIAHGIAEKAREKHPGAFKPFQRSCLWLHDLTLAPSWHKNG